VRAALAALLKEFRAIAPQVKWARPENMHLTLKFLGETDSSKLTAMQAALSAIRSSQSVTLHFRGLGFFPNAKRAKVFWAGMEASPKPAVARGGDRPGHAPNLVSLWKTAPSPRISRWRAFSLPAFPIGSLPPRKKLPHAISVRSLPHEFHLIESKLKTRRGGVHYSAILPVRRGGLSLDGREVCQPLCCFSCSPISSARFPLGCFSRGSLAVATYGNPAAAISAQANVARVAGPLPGILTLVFDAPKAPSPSCSRRISALIVPRP